MFAYRKEDSQATIIGMIMAVVAVIIVSLVVTSNPKRSTLGNYIVTFSDGGTESISSHYCWMESGYAAIVKCKPCVGCSEDVAFSDVMRLEKVMDD